MKCNHKILKLVLICAMLVLSLCKFEKIEAAEKSRSEVAKDGVVQVNSVYTDDAGNEHVVYGGTGFIIGNSEETEFVITSNHIVVPSEDAKNEAFEYLGVERKDDSSYGRIGLKYEVIVEGDVAVDASLLTSSSELDVAVLQLSQPIYTRTPLAIYTAAEGEEVPYAISESVYALGFPDGIRFDSESFYFSNEQVSMSAGNIVNILSLNGIQTIEHSAAIADNNCGGPLVDENGYVIGVNTLATDGVYNCAVDSTKLVKILDGLGVEYEKVTFVEEEVIEEPVEVIEPEPEKKTNYILIICIAIVAVIAIAATVIVICILRKDKAPQEKKIEKKNKKSKEIEETNEALARFTSKDPAKANVRVVVPMGNDGGQDTMVLGGGNTADETNVLGASKSVSEQLKVGTLIRQKSGEKITINKNYFVVGKDSLHVDYCIKDNGTISRQHCAIRQAQDGVYLEDCNSTNGTYINGVRLITNKPEKLRGGDVICVSNEEFEYQAK